MRSFFCIDLPPQVKRALGEATRPLRAAEARVGWVRAELLHVTLKFLGEIDATQALALHALARDAVQGVGPFDLVLERFGAFPHWQRPRVLWVGSHHTPQALRALQGKLDAQLAALGHPCERAFFPHVTLGRVRDAHPSRLRALSRQVQAQPLTPLRVRATHLTLMESVLGAGGPRYAPLFEVAL